MEIEIIIRDEQGQIINQQTAKRYELGTGLNSLSAIEGAVEGLKQKMLPALEADLLSRSQAEAIQAIKKRASDLQRTAEGHAQNDTWSVQV